jgi:hypothetical protein
LALDGREIDIGIQDLTSKSSSNKNLDIPQKYKANVKLGNWFSNQRYQCIIFHKYKTASSMAIGQQIGLQWKMCTIQGDMDSRDNDSPLVSPTSRSGGDDDVDKNDEYESDDNDKCLVF